jgi:chromate reductase
MNAKKKILAISGSTRTHSSNESILLQIADLYSEAMEVEIFDGVATLPYFNPDMDNGEPPETVINFRKKIELSDGVLICTPEYVFSLPGALKNAIEWTVSTTVFAGKPVALIVASGLGDKAYESLILIMNTVGANVGEQSKLLIKGARSKLNEQRQITDKSVLADIDKLVRSFMEVIESTGASGNVD